MKGMAKLILHILYTMFLFVNTVDAQDVFKVFLVGDAGDHTESGETLINLHKELIKNPHSAVVFLGDNSYKDMLWGVLPYGYKGFDSSRNAQNKIMSQLKLLEKYEGSAFFIPGNHDWWNRTTYQKGVGKLAMEESFIEKNLKKNLSLSNPGNVFQPKNGDYGPSSVELNHHSIRLIFIDTYRIIQTGIKKGKVPEEEKVFYHRLDSLIREGFLKKQKILVVGHHPVHSIGPYTRALKRPYFFSRIKSSSPDFPSYREMSTQINRILCQYPDIYYASGHLHALQYFYGKDSVHFIISGAGSKEKKLSVKDISKYDDSMSPNEFLLWNTGGFFSLEFGRGREITILYYNNGTQKCSLPE